MPIKSISFLGIAIVALIPAARLMAGEQENADRAQIGQLIAAARVHGDPVRGAAVFSSQKYACVSCHRVGQEGGRIGPELTRIGATYCPEEIAESLLWPKRKVKPEFVATAVATDSGTLRQGYITNETAERITLRDAATGETLTLSKQQIVERQELGSLMPEGLAAAMTASERQDVMRFLLELGREDGPTHQQLLAHVHQPGTFPYDFAPLERSYWRFTGHPVNRDRLYDFYAKEADYFRTQADPVALLPAFPGLDGGRYGHWGNQNEDSWRDDRWNRMELGSLMCGIVRDGERLVSRGVCVRLGERDELAVCFDADTLSYVSAWKGGFVKFSPVRHGFVDALIVDGGKIEIDSGKLPDGERRYRGYYRHGRQVVFAYDIGDERYFDAPTIENGRLQRIVAPAETHPLRELARGGPSQWPQVLETRGTLGGAAPYAIDTIAPPLDNPWNAPLFFGGHDFLPDGSALLCTMQGDVWHVTGLDRSLAHVRWKRFAAGLHFPLGLVVADGEVYVLGRNQITRLHDLNGDDEADFYECFSNALVTSSAGHDFICGLERDLAGNFYTSSGNQGLLRIAPDGQKVDVLATGFRNPDGLGLLPDGGITVPCSEGEWTATSMICEVSASQIEKALETKQPSHFGYGGPQSGRPPELPLVFLPRGLDNSSGGQTCVDSRLWGPLAGQMVHFSYGAGTYHVVLRDEVAGQRQGAVVPMPGDFASGAHRGRFHPIDGQLYVTGMGGWGTYTAEDGSFERVRYTGQPVQLPSAFHVHENGVLVSFTLPVDSTIASQADQQFAQAWNYRYGPGYGSAEYSPSHPGTVGHDRLAISGGHALDDGRSVFFEIPDLQPVNQLHLRMRVDHQRPLDLFATVHALDKPFTRFSGYQAKEKTIAAHPLLADLAQLSQPPAPNPWRESMADAREVTIEAGKNLTFATRSLTVRAGEAIKLSFQNPDVVPHNWVLLKSGKLVEVGQQVNRLIADLDAARRHYVPASDDVLAYTDIVPAGQQFAIYFRAPATPGRYPYLCSFPGHWMVMNGQLIVIADGAGNEPADGR